MFPQTKVFSSEVSINKHIPEIMRQINGNSDKNRNGKIIETIDFMLTCGSRQFFLLKIRRHPHKSPGKFLPAEFPGRFHPTGSPGKFLPQSLRPPPSTAALAFCRFY